MQRRWNTREEATEGHLPESMSAVCYPRPRENGTATGESYHHPSPPPSIHDSPSSTVQHGIQQRADSLLTDLFRVQPPKQVHLGGMRVKEVTKGRQGGYAQRQMQSCEEYSHPAENAVPTPSLRESKFPDCVEEPTPIAWRMK